MIYLDIPCSPEQRFRDHRLHFFRERLTRVPTGTLNLALARRLWRDAEAAAVAVLDREADRRARRSFWFG